MSGNIFALRQRQIELKAEADGIFSAARNGFSARQRTRLAALKTELEEVQADIQQRDYEIASDLNPSAPLAAHHGKGNDMHSNNSSKIYNKLSDQLLASGMKPTQKSDSLAPFNSLGDQLRSVANAERSRGANLDPRLVEIQAALGGNESVPAEGGFVVIPEFAAGLLKRTYDVSLISQKCLRMPMASNRLIMHAVDEDSRKDGARFGGITGFWLAEGATYTPTKPKFREMQFVANKLIALSYATEEQLADGPAWEAYVTETVPQELAFQIDEAVYNGPGAGAPLGFMNSGALLVVNKDAGQTAATVTTSNVINMWSRMWARSRQNATWYINQDIEPSLIPLTLGSPSLAQVLVYTAPGINGNPGPYGKMFGRDVIPVEQAETLGTQGDLVLADMTQYVLAQRAGMRADTSIHVAFLTGEQAFRFMLRLDGQPSWKKPLTPYQGSITKSPFVCLQTRS
jgi:HK97 family phage major capsid protein